MAPFQGRTLALSLALGTLALLAPPAAANGIQPCAPTGFDAQPLGVVIHLTWDAVENATEYRIYRAEGDGEFRLVIMQEPSNETFDTHVERGVTYRYRMTAIVDGEESQACAAVTVTAGGPCAPEVSAMAQDGPRIRLTWTAVVVADSYNVYRAEGDGDFAFLASTDASTQGYMDLDVEADGVYRYQVKAVIGGSERPACNTAQATAIPDFPTLGAIALAGAAGLGAYALVARRRKA